MSASQLQRRGCDWISDDVQWSTRFLVMFWQCNPSLIPISLLTEVLLGGGYFFHGCRDKVSAQFVALLYVVVTNNYHDWLCARNKKLALAQEIFILICRMLLGDDANMVWEREQQHCKESNKSFKDVIPTVFCPVWETEAISPHILSKYTVS